MIKTPFKCLPVPIKSSLANRFYKGYADKKRATKNNEDPIFLDDAKKKRDRLDSAIVKNLNHQAISSYDVSKQGLRPSAVINFNNELKPASTFGKDGLA